MRIIVGLVAMQSRQHVDHHDSPGIACTKRNEPNEKRRAGT